MTNQNASRQPIIDPTRTVTVESETIILPGRSATVWYIVTRCPIDGIIVDPDCFASREEAQDALDAMFSDYDESGNYIGSVANENGWTA